MFLNDRDRKNFFDLVSFIIVFFMNLGWLYKYFVFRVFYSISNVVLMVVIFVLVFRVKINDVFYVKVFELFI